MSSLGPNYPLLTYPDPAAVTPVMLLYIRTNEVGYRANLQFVIFCGGLCPIFPYGQ